jgi:hypothetical protein
MKTHIMLIMVLSLVLSSCNSGVTSTLRTSENTKFNMDKFTLFCSTDTLPVNAVKLGWLRVGGNWFTENYSFDYILETAKYYAKKIGGNAFKVTSFKPSNFFTNTPHLKADVYLIKPDSLKNNNAGSNIAELYQNNNGSIIIHFFRLKDRVGSLVNYDVHIGDSVVWKAKNNSKFSLTINQAAAIEIWAKTEAKDKVKLVLDSGKEYYIKCEIETGTYIGVPKLTLIKNELGRFEFNLIE